MEKLSSSSVKVSQKSIYIHIIKIYINKWLPEFLDIFLDLVKNFK